MIRSYGNIGVLDLRNTKDEVLAEGLSAQNIGVIIYSSQTSNLLSKVKAHNIGASIECDDDVQLIQGVTEITSSRLENLKSPLNLMIMGKLVVSRDVTQEALEKGLGSIFVQGKVICPEGLLPTLQSKAKDIKGKIASYPDDHRLFHGGLSIDNNFLGSLEDGSRIALLGDVSIEKGLDLDLLTKKVSSLFIQGKLSTFASCALTLTDLLHPNSTHKTEVIPDGFEIIDRPIRIENSDVELWENKKLYFLESVEFDKDVEPELLDANLSELKAKESVYCHSPLKKVLAKKCDPFKTRIISYKDNMFANASQNSLSASQLEYLEGSLTLVNEGILEVGPEVSREAIIKTIDKVYNYGILIASKEQLGPLRSKTSENEGQMLEIDGPDQGRVDISNAGVLQL